MDLEEAESLIEQFLDRASVPLGDEAVAANRRWNAYPIDDEDLFALDSLMRRLLELEEVEVRLLVGRLGISVHNKVPSDKVRRHIHPITKRLQYRWGLFDYLRTRIVALRAERGTGKGEVRVVIRQGTEEASEAAAGAEWAVGVR